MATLESIQPQIHPIPVDIRKDLPEHWTPWRISPGVFSQMSTQNGKYKKVEVPPSEEKGTLGSFLASLGTKKGISLPKEPNEELWSSIESLKNDISIKSSLSLTSIRLAAFTSMIKITTALNGYEAEDLSQDEKTVVKQQLTIFGPTFSSKGILEKLFVIIQSLDSKWKFG